MTNVVMLVAVGDAYSLLVITEHVAVILKPTVALNNGRGQEGDGVVSPTWGMFGCVPVSKLGR